MKERKKLIVTVAACLLVQLFVGVIYLWSVFRGPVVAHFNWSNEASTMVFSYMMFAFVFGALIGGFIQDKTNPKLVATIGCVIFCGGIFLTSLLNEGNIGLIYLTYSGLSGLGCGFVYGSVLSCLQKWMPHRRGFASGLSVFAFGLSTVVFAPLINYLLKLPAFGVEAVPLTFRTLSLSFFVLSMIACAFIKLPSEAYLKSLNLPADISDAESSAPGQTLRTLPFWCVAITVFCINAMWNILSPLIKDLSLSRGLSENLALTALSLTGISNAVGRLSVASLSDKIGRGQTLQLLGLITFASGIALIFIQGPLLIFFILLLAFTYGGGSATFPAITTDLFGPKYAATNYGLALLSLGFSSIVFNAISNAFFTLTGSYTLSFAFGGVSGALAILLMIPVRKAYTKRNLASKEL